jgi:hypothetical protein
MFLYPLPNRPLKVSYRLSDFEGFERQLQSSLVILGVFPRLELGRDMGMDEMVELPSEEGIIEVDAVT